MVRSDVYRLVKRFLYIKRSGDMIPMVILQMEDSDDRKFMSELYTKYIRLMYYIAKKWTSQLEEQEDIVQEALMKLVEKVGRLRELDEPRRANYISHTVRNTAIKHLEKKSRESRTLLDVDISQLNCAYSDEYFSLDEQFIQKEWREEFRRIWEQLPEREKLLLEGKYIFCESNEEIAQWMNCRPSSVRMALTRARRMVLQKLMRGEDDAESKSNTGAV